MGCSDSGSVGPTLTLEQELEIQKRNVMAQIEENNFKVATYENEIDRFNQEIKDGENTLKLKGYELTEAEKKTKFNRLMELQKDRARVQRSLDSLKAFNEQMKNNLENIGKKMNEQRVAKVFRDENNILKKIEKEDNNDVIRTNADNLLSQKLRDEKTRKNVERMNNAYNGNDVINEDEYMRQLLGYGTKPGY